MSASASTVHLKNPRRIPLLQPTFPSVLVSGNAFPPQKVAVRFQHWQIYFFKNTYRISQKQNTDNGIGFCVLFPFILWFFGSPLGRENSLDFPNSAALFWSSKAAQVRLDDGAWKATIQITNELQKYFQTCFSDFLHFLRKDLLTCFV